MGSIKTERRISVRSVAIIGAGPSGLAMAKYLSAERAFDRIAIFEQRATVGGIWNHTPLANGRAPADAVPQTDPHADYEDFLTPLYDRLETNIPKEMMGFSDLDWPRHVQLFPTHTETLRYIERYSQEVRHLIRFDTQVVDVSQRDGSGWRVRTRKVGAAIADEINELAEESFDAVCVASGHFNVPFIPSVPGIGEFNKSHPGSISHSKFFRAPESYRGKKVVIVGNSASGVDIGNQIAEFARLPVIYSQKSESFLEPDQSPARLEKPVIVQYIGERRAVRFADGTEEADVDAIVYCTGYFYSFPFLKSLQEGKRPLITTGEYVNGLYQHLFLRSAPTMAFLALTQKIIPFPMAEAQAAAVAAAWAGRLALPSEHEMYDWENGILEASKREAEERGDPEDWARRIHVLANLKDAEYINQLHDWTLTAEQRTARVSDPNELATTEIGKIPPYWGCREYWLRPRIPTIKKAFAAQGEERHVVKSLEDIGYGVDRLKNES